MPKMRTKQAAAKRLKVKAKPPKRRRRLGKAVLVAKVDEPRLKRLVPYL